MFAVIKTGGKQYRVAANDLLKVEKIEGAVGDIVQLGAVLAVGAGQDVAIGQPFVDGASIAAEVVEQGRAPTVIAFKKRRRQNSRRKRGQRQLLTTIRVTEILTGGAKPSPKPAAPEKAAPLFSAPDGPADDLTAIKGIGPVAAGQLAEQGIATFAQLAALSDEDIARIDAAMPFSADQIADWREQAQVRAE